MQLSVVSSLCAIILVSVLQQDAPARSTGPVQYRVLDTNKASTMQKELSEAGDQNYEFGGMTVGKTLVGGDEGVAILRRTL